jgi:glutathione S-transferase
VIYEYLDSLHDGSKMFLPADTPERFLDMRRMSMGEWMFDIANIRNFEQNRPDEHVVTKNVDRMENQIRRAMDWADAECESYSGLTIGQICIACALLYHQWQKDRGRDLPDWRDGRPRLTAWYDRFTDRPSFVPRDEEVEEAA